MRSLHSHYILGLLTLSYLLGELGHFLLGSTSRSMSRELEYGDQACLGPPDCAGQQTEETCLAAGPHCDWNYTGLGLDYQLLAGPTFITVFSVSGVLFGLAADLTHRPRLLGAAVITFSSALLVTSQAGSYWELVLARMLLAAGESACSPVCVSLISDLYPERHRALATAVLHLGVYLGFGLSQAAGIYLTQLDLLGFSWRAPYFLTGVPGIVVGLLLLLLPDPRKTSQGRAKKEELLTELKELKEVKELKELKEVEEVRGGSGLEYLKSTLLTPFMLTMFLAAATRHAAGFTWAYNCRLYFLSYYPQSDVGTYFSLSAILGGATGVILGGATADRLAGRLCQGLVMQSKELEVRKVKIKLLILGLAMIAAAPFSVGVLYLDPPFAFVSLFCYYLLAETWFGILFVTLVSVSPPQLKTTVLGIFLFLMNTSGGNLPVLVHPISKLVGYREALLILFPVCMLVSGVLFTLAVIFVKAQMRRITVGCSTKDHK